MGYAAIVPGSEVMLRFRRMRVLTCIAAMGLLGGCGTPGTPEQVKNEPIRAPGEVTLFDKLGGAPAIYAITDNFIDRAIADPQVNFQRDGHSHTWKSTPDSLGRLKLAWAQYLDMLADGPQMYEGRNMFDTHHGMNISEGEWFALLDDLKKSLDLFQVPADLQQDLIQRVAGTHDAIVNK